MIMMLPFLTGMLAVWFGIRYRRGWCLWLWFLTLVIFAASAKFHMTDSLGLTL